MGFGFAASSPLVFKKSEPLRARRDFIKARRIKRKSTLDISALHLRKVPFRQSLCFLPILRETAANRSVQRNQYQDNSHGSTGDPAVRVKSSIPAFIAFFH